MGFSGVHSGQVRPVRERKSESVRKRASMRGLGFRACVRGGERVLVRVCEVKVWHERGVYRRGKAGVRTCERHASHM